MVFPEPRYDRYDMRTIPPFRRDLRKFGVLPGVEMPDYSQNVLSGHWSYASSTRQQLLLDAHFFQRDEFRQAAFGRQLQFAFDQGLGVFDELFVG